MAHMWFGNLVTMKWWDDLWLNESFAEWACYHAAVEATEFDESWTGFTNARKNWALRQDQLPSTHPIAADNYDLQAVEVNFDGITYAKGASVLKQLVAWVGLENFLFGLRGYFKRHAFGNSEFSDLLRALEESSGRELDSWAKEWLQTSGVNTLTPRFEVDDEGNYSSISVVQTAPVEHPTLRRHRIGIGLYDLEPNAEGVERLVRRTSLEVDVDGESTEIDGAGRRTPAGPAAAQRRRPHLRQDPARRALAGDRDRRPLPARRLARSGPVLGRRVGHDARRRDERHRLRHPRAREHRGRDRRLRLLPDPVVRRTGRRTTSPHRPTGPSSSSTWEQGLRRLLDEAEPGSDHQLTYARAFAARPPTRTTALDDLEALLDGSLVLDGLTVDTDMRWALLAGLARAGRADDERIASELRRDNTISGQERAAAARAARPTAEAKAEAWQIAVVRDDVPNETQRSVVLAFMQPGQEEVLQPYLEKYLEVAETLWEEKGTQRASTALEFLFPRPLASPELLERVSAWLHDSRANASAKRYAREGAADVERYLAGQEKDARG